MLGVPYTSQRLDQKRLIYLHRILNRHEKHWTKLALNTLVANNVGWGKSIQTTLSDYDLPNDFTTIRCITRRQWRKLVKNKIEVKNTTRIINDCYKKENGKSIPKTKTAHIIAHIQSDDYVRKPQLDIIQCTKQEAKTIIISRFGMLECGKNYKGTMSETCKHCNVTDDEDHRINHCIKFKHINFYSDTCKKEFRDIFSEDMNVIRRILPVIERIWNTRIAHGTMRQ